MNASSLALSKYSGASSMTDKKTLSNLYHAGMAFAAQLRLVGEHEAAHDIEVYVLDIKKELEDASTEE